MLAQVDEPLVRRQGVAQFLGDRFDVTHGVAQFDLDPLGDEPVGQSLLELGFHHGGVVEQRLAEVADALDFLFLVVPPEVVEDLVEVALRDAELARPVGNDVHDAVPVGGDAILADREFLEGLQCDRLDDGFDAVPSRRRVVLDRHDEGVVDRDRLGRALDDFDRAGVVGLRGSGEQNPVEKNLVRFERHFFGNGRFAIHGVRVDRRMRQQQPDPKKLFGV